MAAQRAAGTPVRELLRQFAFKTSGYREYGLLYDDLLRETPAVAEAIRRLPEKIVHERNFRGIRAMQLSMEKKILPEEEWTTYEADVRYLQPIVDQVQKEFDEVEEWTRRK